MSGVRLALLGTLFFSTSAFAQSLAYETANASNYDYVEVDYLRQDSGIPTGTSEDLILEGFGVRGSFQFYENFFATASYTDVSLEGNSLGVDADADGYSVGIGYIFAENDTGSFFGEVTYNRAEASATLNGLSASTDENTVGVGAGFRLNTSQRTELKFGLNYVDSDVVDDDLTGYGEFVFDFFEHVSGVVAVSRVADETGFAIGARYSF